MFVYEVPVAPDGTVPANCSVTDCPVGNEDRLQLSVAAENVTPGGRFGLEMLVSPWAGRVSTTFRCEVSDGPPSDTTIL